MIRLRRFHGLRFRRAAHFPFGIERSDAVLIAVSLAGEALHVGLCGAQFGVFRFGQRNGVLPDAADDTRDINAFVIEHGDRLGVALFDADDGAVVAEDVLLVVGSAFELAGLIPNDVEAVRYGLFSMVISVPHP